MNVAHGEMVEKELNHMIEKRSRKEPDPCELEPSYAESVRRYNATRAAENRAAWSDYHQGQAKRLRRVMTALVAFHEDKARQLLEEGSA